MATVDHQFRQLTGIICSVSCLLLLLPEDSVLKQEKSRGTGNINFWWQLTVRLAALNQNRDIWAPLTSGKFCYELCQIKVSLLAIFNIVISFKKKAKKFQASLSRNQFWAEYQNVVVKHEESAGLACRAWNDSCSWNELEVQTPTFISQLWVIPWFSSFTKQLLHEEINVYATNIIYICIYIYMAWMLKQKAQHSICSKHCHQVRAITDKADNMPGRRRGQAFKTSRISLHTHCGCSCYKYWTTPATQRLRFSSYTCSAWILSLPKPYMLLWEWEEKDKWNSGWI